MKNNETGEFELVVGNKQLVSGFFIGVLLLAVVFAMGYVVGQNTQRPQKSAEAAAATSPAAPAEARPQAASPAPVQSPAAETSAPPDTAANPPADTPPQPTTQPTREVQAEAPPPAPAPAPVTAKAREPVVEPPAGAYWQVLATANMTAAQTMLQSLRDKGFPATLGPGPNNLTRVLVGPYSDTAAMAGAKTEIEKTFGVHPIKK